jgi:hypothetical protein
MKFISNIHHSTGAHQIAHNFKELYSNLHPVHHKWTIALCPIFLSPAELSTLQGIFHIIIILHIPKICMQTPHPFFPTVLVLKISPVLLFSSHSQLSSPQFPYQCFE